MSATLLGPRWTGMRLRLERPEDLGLEHGDLVGWSDFYGGGPCTVNVAYATNGKRNGYLVWGGNLGLRALPGHLGHADRSLGDVLQPLSILWIDDVSMLPAEVQEAVEYRADEGVSRDPVDAALEPAATSIS